MLGFPAIAAILIFVAVYLVIATERPVSRTSAVLAGAGAVLALRIGDAHSAFFSEETGVDWNVVFLLLGMMVIVSVLRETGLFEYLAIWAAKRVRGRPYPLMVLLVLLTAVASALLDNVTTVLLMAPVTILICRRLGLAVVPYLIAEVAASNIGGTATLVGDPPNIIIASRAGLSFNDFLVHLAPLVLVLLLVFLGLCRWLFRGAFDADADRVAQVLAMDERAEIRDARLLVKSLVVLGLVLVAFVLHPVLHYQPSVVALLGAGLLVAVTRMPARRALQEVEWSTLVFFMGLFVLVGALVSTGVLSGLTRAVAGFAGSDELGFTAVLLWGSALLSSVVDNIPYVASMSPVVAELVGPDGQPQVLWWALALGADLGGNATLIGASANVVVAGIAARHGCPIGFWRFARYGLLITLPTLVVASLYVWLRYFVAG